VLYLIFTEGHTATTGSGLSVGPGAHRRGRPAARGRPADRAGGAYQLQAAIAAVHAEAPRAADTDWAQIQTLYRMLGAIAPGPMVELNHAVAVAMVDGPAAGLAMLEPLLGDRQLRRHHRLHAVHAHLLEMDGPGGRPGSPTPPRPGWPPASPSSATSTTRRRRGRNGMADSIRLSSDHRTVFADSAGHRFRLTTWDDV